MRRIVWTLIPLLLLAACGGAANQATPVLGVVGSTPGKALATVWLSPTPPPNPQPPAEPTFTPAPTLPLPTIPGLQPTLPIGTVGPLLQDQGTPQANRTPGAPLNCTTLPAEPFTEIWQRNPAAQDRLGCPTGDAQQRLAAFQPFEYGYMIWVQADDSIYVLSNKAIRQGQETDTWWRLEDTFAEGEPAYDESLVAPEGLLQPERGFGKVWRTNGFVREAVGWAIDEEIGYDATWLNFEGGWMITAPSVLPIFVLVPSDDPPYSTGIHLGPQITPLEPAPPPDLP